MGAHSKIGWTDHSFNGWWGCTKVSPACDFCYAEKLDARAGASHWGPGTPRRRTSENNWNQPRKWNQIAERNKSKPRVFCSSMCDWADNEVPDEWRQDLFRLWRETPNLRWQALTKRIGNASKMLPPDFPCGYEHVGIMATIANQEEANRDIPKLLGLKAERGVTWVGISCEPLLGPIDLTRIRFKEDIAEVLYNSLSGESMVENSDSPSAYDTDGPTIDWVIVGGESGGIDKVRPFVIEDARSLLQQCTDSGTAIFIKQLGRLPTLGGNRFHMRDVKGETMTEWPADLCVQQFPAYLTGSGFPAPEQAKTNDLFAEEA